MDRRIEEFFANEKIEYYAAISYNDVRETRKYLIEREDFIPRSVIMFLLPYYGGECDNISRYAASLDYHIVIRDLTERLVSLLEKLYPESKAKGYGDHSPIDERDAALSADLGILGRNGLLINEKYGTYIFIADVITDIPPEVLGVKEKAVHRECCGCGICLSFCPTGILIGRGSDCLSAITQKKGELSHSDEDLMRKYNTVWGCDECQCHCPHNADPKISPIEFFHRDRIERLDLDTLNSLSDEEFKKRAFAWRGRSVVERNIKLFE